MRGLGRGMVGKMVGRDRKYNAAEVRKMEIGTQRVIIWGSRGALGGSAGGIQGK